MDNSYVEENVDGVTGMLLRRETERQQAMVEKREKEEENMLSIEHASKFTDTFTQKKCEIEDALNAAELGEIDKNQLPFHFEKINKDIVILQRFTSDSAEYILQYDIRKSKETIQSLQQKWQELQKKLLPKEKFGFKIKKGTCITRKETLLQKIEDAVDSVAVSTLPLKAFCGYAENNCGFSGRTGEILSLSPEVVNNKDTVLTNLVGCTVKLVGSPSTLHMTSLHNCRILCGPVKTSVFIDGCADCIFLVACQQLRIHNTKRCDVYSHVTSRTVIEDSTQIGFAPYSWKYENIEHHFKIAGLDMNRNNWNLIDDFNWLASDAPSPNWRVLKADEKKDGWV
jgi:hypothetical protein